MAVQINVAANQAALTASIQAGVQAYNQRFAQNNQLNLTVNQRAFSQPLGRMTGDVKDFEAALAASNARVIAFGASTAVLGGVIRSFKELASVTIDVEKNLADINRVFGLTTSQLQKFSTDLFSVGKQTASTFDDASKAALEFSRQGLKAEDVLIRTKDALTLTRLAGISTANAVDALTSTVNGFATTGITTTQILNKLVAVEQDYAVGAGDLAEALSRTGQAAQEAGVSLDQLNALVTSAQQSTARGGAVIGNALKTIFTRLQRTDTLDQLEAFNISVRDVQGNILPAVQILQNFAGAYKGLADAQRAQLSEQVAGVYQVNILKAIVGDLNKSQGVYAGALQRGASATNEAEVATAKLNQTLDALLKQTATSTQQLANNIGKVTFEPLAKYGTEQLKSFVESMNEVLEGEGVGSTFANGLLKGIRNVIAGPGAIAAFFTLFKLIQNSFTYLAQALPQIAGITTETQNRKNIEQSILQIMQQQGPVSQALAGTMGNQAAQAQLLLQVARQQTAEYQMQTTLAKQLAVQLAGQGVRVKGSGGLQVTRAGGYIPAATRMAEVVGAQAGGYAPGRVVSSPVGGVMNTAEDVKYIPGFAQPFINPPAGSKAGRAHRQNSINKTGIDPYMYGGFIPNFATKKDQILFNKRIGRAFEDKVGMDIGMSPSFNKPIDFISVPKVPSDPAKEYNKNFYSSQTFADAYSGTGHNAATNIGKVIRHLNLNYGNMLKNPYSDDYFFDGKDLILDPNFTEIIGKGKDQPIAIASSRASSLAPDSKSVFLQGLNKKQQTKALKQGIIMEFAKDKVNVDYDKFNGFIPNFATGLSPKVTRLPWLKSFANKEWFDRFPWFNDIELKNTSQNMDYNPYTGEKKLIPGSEMFRELNFLTHGNNKNLKTGNSSLFSYLYEEYVRKILNSVTQGGSVLDSEEAGFPVRDKFGNPTKFDPFKAANTAPMDALIRNRAGRIGGIEIKGGTEENWKTKDILKKEQDFEAQNPGSTLGRRTRVYSNMYKGTDFLNKGLLKRVGVDKAKSITNNLISFYASKIAGHESEIASNWKANKGLSGGFVPNFAKELEATAGYGSSIYGELNRNKLSIESMDRGNYPIKDPASKKRSVSNILYSGIIEKAKKIIGKDKDLFITGELLPQDKGLAFPQGLSRVKLAKTAIGNLVDPKGASKKLNKEQLLNLLIDPKQQQYLRDSLLELTTTHSKGFIPNFANFIDVDTLGKNSVHYSGDLMKLIKDIESSIGRNLSSGELRFLTNPKTNLSKLNDPKVLNRFINSERKGGFAGFAKGFLPNFAYKQAVMGLEESMSGNKAIFDTKPFPHIRNSSQPTFSSAIADHGGLGNALSDSMRGQKNAGLMNKGYVPNFANSRSARRRISRNQSQNAQSGFNTNQLQTNAERLAQDALTKINNAYQYIAVFGAAFADVIENTSKSAINKLGNATSKVQSSIGNLSSNLTSSFGNISNSGNRFAKFSEGLSKASTAISIAGPMIAGLAEQTIFGNRKRTEMTAGERSGQAALSTGLSAFSTGVGIGSAFGLPGAIIGGIAGSLVGLTSALNAATLSAEELAQLNDEQTQKAQANITAASSYVEAQKSLTDMVAKGASSTEIETATKNLANNFSQIKDTKLQEMFLSAGGDVAIMTRQLQEYTNQVAKESAKQTGLYGGNLKSEERASALSIGLGKEGSLDFITKAREAVKKADKAVQDTYNFYNEIGGDEAGVAVDVAEMKKKDILKNFAESIVPSNEKERSSKVESLFNNLLDKNFEEVLKVLEKNINVTEVSKAAANFQQAATRSFNQIFLDVEQAIAKSAFDIALSFEKDSGSRKIQSTILDFSMNFQDSLNSFLSNNLPDVRKFDFTAATAGQKAQMLLQKSQQDYDKAIADQANERANFLSKNSENLTKEFKSSFLQSQASAEFYQNNILPQIQQGVFSGNAQSLAKQFESASFTEAQAKVTKAGFSSFTLDKTSTTLEKINNQMSDLSLMNQTNTEDYQKLLAAQKALIDLQNQTALFQNQNEMKKLQTVLNTAAREQELFDTKQANAKKELEINKQLSEARIAADKDIAIEKAKVDKQILMRMESMKDVSAQIGNTLEISKANINASIAALQSNLEDSRQTYGKSSSQILERRIDIQDSILKQQRELEDQTIKSEIQQRILQMAVEQENTAATLKLNDTIMTLVESQLRGELGGTANMERIYNTMQTAGPQEVDNIFGIGALSKYQALQGIQESRTASASINSNYNTSNFAANMETAGFNKTDENGNLMMSTQEQINFLSKEELKAKEANNIVLEGTIKRYKEEIRVKEKSLSITRDQLDKSIALKNEESRAMVTFGGRLSAGFGKLSDQADNIIHNLAEELPMKFADNMSSALMEVAKGTKSIGDAFQDMAINFGQMIMQEVMRAAIAKTLGNIGIGSLFGQAGGNVSARGIGYQHGGVIRANNGQYVSGMGSGDRYPAMLENGEYVLNREAVKQLGGKGALDTFNFQHAPRFASGGNVNMEAEMALNKDQEMDYTKNLLYNRSNIGAINENDYTAYAYSESDYFKKMREKAIANEQKRVQDAFAKKQKNAQLISSLVGTAGSLFLAAGMSGLAKAGASGNAVSSGAAKAKPASLGSGMGSSNVSSFSATIGSQRGGMIGFNSGGFVPYGSRLSDTIPALLTGGEYVMNNAAVKKYGLGAMNAMNAGAMSNNTNTNSTSTNNNTNNNSTNISINIDRSGKATYGSDTNSYEKNDIAFSKQMAKRVADIAKGVISDESRYGGKIYQR
jgi:TP901 family phage tail tape measure protein